MSGFSNIWKSSMWAPPKQCKRLGDRVQHYHFSSEVLGGCVCDLWVVSRYRWSGARLHTAPVDYFSSPSPFPPGSDLFAFSLQCESIFCLKILSGTRPRMCARFIALIFYTLSALTTESYYLLRHSLPSVWTETKQKCSYVYYIYSVCREI